MFNFLQIKKKKLPLFAAHFFNFQRSVKILHHFFAVSFCKRAQKLFCVRFRCIRVVTYREVRRIPTTVRYSALCCVNNTITSVEKPEETNRSSESRSLISVIEIMVNVYCELSRQVILLHTWWMIYRYVPIWDQGTEGISALFQPFCSF